MNPKEKLGLLVITILVIVMALYPKYERKELTVCTGVCIDVGKFDYAVHDLSDGRTYIVSDPLGLVNLPIAGDTVVYTR